MSTKPSEKFIKYTNFRSHKDKQCLCLYMIKCYSSAITSSCFHIHENKKLGGSTIC